MQRIHLILLVMHQVPAVCFCVLNTKIDFSHHESPNCFYLLTYLAFFFFLFYVSACLPTLTVVVWWFLLLFFCFGLLFLIAFPEKDLSDFAATHLGKNVGMKIQYMPFVVQYYPLVWVTVAC